MYKIKSVNEIDFRFCVIVRVEKVLVIIVVIFMLEMIMIIFLYIIDVLL